MFALTAQQHGRCCGQHSIRRCVHVERCHCINGAFEQKWNADSQQLGAGKQTQRDAHAARGTTIIFKL